VLQNSHRPRPQVFHGPGGAELQGVASRRGPQAHELANGLIMSIAVPSQDLSGSRVTIQG
jgi:hypothetical protein